MINGKLYNTKKTIPIASWDNGIEISDPRFSEETLCKTKTEEYIIYSKDANGVDIKAITLKDAFEWLQEHDLLGKVDIELIQDIEEVKNT